MPQVKYSDKKSKNKKNGLIIEEAAAVYVPLIKKFSPNKTRYLYGTDSDSVAMLNSSVNKPESRMTALEKMAMARSGLSKTDLEALKEKSALGYDELAKALSVTRATLINKKGDEKFNSQLSERIIGLADIYSYGYEVFEDKDRFNKWMFRANQALGGKIPYDFIDNQFGREEIKNIIGRIDYGVYS